MQELLFMCFLWRRETMITEIERLNEGGLNRFKNAIARKMSTNEELEEILQDYSTETKREVEVHPQQYREKFQSRFDFGRFLVDLIPYTSENENAIYTDIRGIGAWLSLKFIDAVTVIEKGKDGEDERFKKEFRYIPNLNAEGTIYRHLVLGTWKLYGMHRESSRVFLASHTSKTRRIITDLSIFSDVMESAAVCKTLNRFFWDFKTKDLKKGSKSISLSTVLRDSIKLMNIVRGKHNLHAIHEDNLYQIFVDKLDEL